MKNKTEQRLPEWTKLHKKILITGHTHRPVLGSKDSLYFNTGSCVHPRCITCIELVHRELSLVKWTLSTKPDRTLFVAREVLAGPVGLDDLLKYS